MPKRPNKKQKLWVEDFCQKYNAQVTKVIDATCGYFYFYLQWREYLPIYSPPHADDEELDFGTGWHRKQLYVELTPKAIDRLRRETILETVYPHCDLQYSRQYGKSIAQTTLPIPQVLELPQRAPKRQKPKRKTKPANGEQQHLPVDQLGQEILKIRLQQGDIVRSRQDLLSKRVAHYSLEMRQTLQMNQALIDLLKQMKATNQEWESAEQLLGVIGELGTLNYIKSIPEWRKVKNLNIAVSVDVTSKSSPKQIQSLES